MKLFIIKILTIFLLIGTIIGGIYAYKVYKIKHFSWKLPENVTTIFMGASQLNRDINEAFYPNSINLASPSERYMFTYLKLNNLLSSNSIDTIFLQLAPTDLWKDADGKYYALNEMKHFIPQYFPYFSFEEVNVYKTSFFSVLESSISKVYKGIPRNFSDYGGYEPLYKEFQRNDRYDSKLILGKGDGNSVNFKYLRKIIDICKENNVKLYFIYCPMFEPNAYYDQDYFFSMYKNYFNDVELLNFRDLELEDSLRYDEHHLNSKGADYFTGFLYNYIHEDN
jgi:hypothetical protein